MTSTTAKPKVLEVQPDGIPDELKRMRQWVLWRLEPKGKGCTAPGFLDTSLAVIMQPLRCWARAPGGRRPGCGGRGARPATSGCSGP